MKPEQNEPAAVWEECLVGEVRRLRYAWGAAKRSRVLHAWLQAGGTVCRSGGGEEIRFGESDLPLCPECCKVLARGLLVVDR